jgi:glycosyltransferase involved in cell wall biosynthesis
MPQKKIIITAPSLDTKYNVSGISSVTNFIIAGNKNYNYRHFKLGRRDDEKRGAKWFFKLIKAWFSWAYTAATTPGTLVHFNFPLSKPSILRDAPLVLVAKLFRKKMVLHLHGGDYLTKPVIEGWIKRILKITFAGHTPIIVLSPMEKQLITERYNVKNVWVLPNCVDLTDATIVTDTINNAAVLNYLFIGRISSAKGLDYIFDAFVALKTKGIPFKFFMAGTGPEEKEYVTKFTDALGSNFEFVGIVSGKAKADLYKSCQVFLLPSLFEGLPMSLLEAMSYGVVPVVTNVGSIKFAVQHEQTGIMLPATEIAAAIATEIEKLHNNRLQLQQLAKAAQQFIFKNYNPETYINTLNEIYAAA